ncbi:unnamed protein product [Pleuronectes platessa]|uniref:Voltage-dependent calcium channel alpha-2/delta subunit conserved region domain-containing protein n=1 Tax=Pleuronectes platessa TaxID=8262 RepID=A0A9N7W1I0_PLEPL|nr:unnamed protein product [Pleuronectes platessa]
MKVIMKQEPSDTDCTNVEGVCPLSCESADLNCFLVDNNGFILLSKDRNEVGRFFGEVDGSVMASLIKMGMFQKVSLFDYQAMCRSTHHHTSSARPLLSPFYCIAALIKWLFYNTLMFLLDFNLCGLWHSDYFVDAHKQRKVEAQQPCDTEYPGFMYDSSIREANSLIKCGRCQKMFVVQQIPDSNLVLVVTQADCDCSRQYGAILLEPKEIKYILYSLTNRNNTAPCWRCCREDTAVTWLIGQCGFHLLEQFSVFPNSSEHNATVKCNRMKSQKVRRRPESCHSYHPKENAKECGGASAISLSSCLLSASVLVSLVLHHWT